MSKKISTQSLAIIILVVAVVFGGALLYANGQRQSNEAAAMKMAESAAMQRKADEASAMKKADEAKAMQKQKEAEAMKKDGATPPTGDVMKKTDGTAPGAGQ